MQQKSLLKPHCTRCAAVALVGLAAAAGMLAVSAAGLLRPQLSDGLIRHKHSLAYPKSQVKELIQVGSLDRG